MKQKLTQLTHHQRIFFLVVLTLLLCSNAKSQYITQNLTPTAVIKEGLALEQSPDGRIFIAERGGIVKVYQNNTVSTVFTVNTITNNEQGLLGMTLHPSFASNGYIYVFYSVNSTPIRHRVERVKVDINNQVISRQEILMLEPIGAGFHNGGDLKFFNGFLYITVGDSQESANSQNLDTYKGKILRVTEDGQPAPGNPFFGNGSVQRQSIWAYGFRNPWRLIANPTANKLFVLDVGTSWEEINEISNPAIRNFAWGHPHGGDGIQTETNLFSNPIFTYATHSDIGNALTNGLLYNPAIVRYPELQGKFIIKDFTKTELRYFNPSLNNPPSTVFFTTPHSNALGMMMGSDGYIYYCSYGSNGDLIKLDYIQAAAPTIVNHPVSQTIITGSPVTFTVSASGASLNYQWQYNNVDIPGATAASYSITAVAPANAGAYKCKVSNSSGSVTSNAVTLTVAPFSNAPQVQIILPLPTLTWNADDVVNFSATATDVEDGTLPDSAFSWSIDLWHEDVPGGGHSHHGASPLGVKSGTFIADNQGEKTPNVWYRFTLTVKDKDGLTTEKFVDIKPNLVNVTATSSPALLTLGLNQKTVMAPATIQAVANATVQELNAPTPQFVGNTRYDFERWTHGGAAKQVFQAPTQGAITYTAVYRATIFTQTPYLGVVAQIPGIIEAENYDSGVDAYFDSNGGGDTDYRPGDSVGTEGCSEGGFNLAYVAKDEWVEYTTNVNTTGNYDIKFRVATPYNNRLLHVEVDGVNVTGAVHIPNTGGFQAWVMDTVSNIALTQGSHIIRLYFDAADINVNKIEFTFTGSNNTAPVADFESSSQVVCIGTPVSFTSGSLGTVNTYNWNFGAGAQPATATGVGPHTVTYNTAGIKTVSLTVANNFGSNTKTATIVSDTCSSTPQSPYGGTPKAIPGRIQVEEYDLDGEGIAYHDFTTGNAGNAFRTDNVDLQAASEGTFNVGWVQTGEWLEYTAIVAQHGDYNIKFRVSTPFENRKLHLEQNGVNITGTINIPNTGGFQNWQTVTVNNIHLHEDATEIRIVFEADDINVNYIDFEYVLHAPVAGLKADTARLCVGAIVTYTSATTGQVDSYSWNFGAGASPATASGIGPHAVSYASTGVKTTTLTTANTAGSSSKSKTITVVNCNITVQLPYNGTPATIPGRIEAEKYDLGGEGIAYHDVTIGNSGGQFRTDDVDIEKSGNNFSIGWVNAGEWMEYTANVTATGFYDIKLRTSTPYNGRALHLEINGINVSGTVIIPVTGSFQNWQTVTVPNIHLQAGVTEFKVFFNTNHINLDYADFILVADSNTIARTGNSITDKQSIETSILKKETLVDNKVTVFPNPSSGVYHLSQNANWVVYTTTGNKLKEGSGKIVNITAHPAGTYLIKIAGSNKSFRIIKQ
jgi:PKD repeat protein